MRILKMLQANKFSKYSTIVEISSIGYFYLVMLDLSNVDYDYASSVWNIWIETLFIIFEIYEKHLYKACAGRHTWQRKTENVCLN